MLFRNKLNFILQDFKCKNKYLNSLNFIRDKTKGTLFLLTNNHTNFKIRLSNFDMSDLGSGDNELQTVSLQEGMSRLENSA